MRVAVQIMEDVPVSATSVIIDLFLTGPGNSTEKRSLFVPNHVKDSEDGLGLISICCSVQRVSELLPLLLLRRLRLRSRFSLLPYSQPRSSCRALPHPAANERQSFAIGVEGIQHGAAST